MPDNPYTEYGAFGLIALGIVLLLIKGIPGLRAYLDRRDEQYRQQIQAERDLFMCLLTEQRAENRKTNEQLQALLARNTEALDKLREAVEKLVTR